MSSILIANRRDPLFGLSREQTLDYLRRSLAGRVHAAYVYGSFARNEMHPDSDIDCILAVETELAFPVRGQLFFDLRDRLPSLEILVYTPMELADLTGDPSPGFWASVTRELQRIL